LAATHVKAAIDEVAALTEKVAGGAGFVDVSGAVEVDLDAGRTFLMQQVGNVASIDMVNVPSGSAKMAEWTIIWDVDATGGYALAGDTSVKNPDGTDFDWGRLDLTANARNVIVLRRVSATTYGWLITTGTVLLDPLVIDFVEDGTALWRVPQGMTIDLGNVTHTEADSTAGTGTLSYEVNGVSASGVTTTSTGDVLAVILTGATTQGVVSIPLSRSDNG